jgi:hypothetical protein
MFELRCRHSDVFVIVDHWCERPLTPTVILLLVSTNTGGQFANAVFDTGSALRIAIYLREFLEKIAILI